MLMVLEYGSHTSLINFTIVWFRSLRLVQDNQPSVLTHVKCIPVGTAFGSEFEIAGIGKNIKTSIKVFCFIMHQLTFANQSCCEMNADSRLRRFISSL